MSRTGRANAARGPQGITTAAAYNKLIQGLDALPLLQGLAGSGAGAHDPLAAALSVEDSDGQGSAPNESVAVAHSHPSKFAGSPPE